MGLLQIKKQVRHSRKEWPVHESCFWIRGDGRQFPHCPYCNSNALNIAPGIDFYTVQMCTDCGASGTPGRIPSGFPSEIEMATGWVAGLGDEVWFSPFNPSPGGFPGYVEHGAQQPAPVSVK